jgi:hypothetical protein
LWQPTPTNANTAIPIENDAVLLVIARISSSRILFESLRTRRLDAPNIRAYSDPILFGTDSGRPATELQRFA